MDYYVYLHRKATTGEVFYVGKGCKDRAWSPAGRNQLWNRIVEKHGYTVEIYKNNLQEWYAFELEVELISKYGRIDQKTGQLCNMTDGGDAPGGEGHPRYDSRLWTFYNTEDGREVNSTKYAFNLKFPGVCTGALFCTTTKQKSSRGWVVKELLSSKEIDFIAGGRRGVLSPVADKKLYHFINIETKEEVKTTQLEMQDLVDGINTSALVNKVMHCSKGWSLMDVYKKKGYQTLRSPIGGISNPKADLNIYSFVNLVSGEEINATRWDFFEQTGVNPLELFSKIRKNLTVKSWCLKENLERAKKDSPFDFNIHRFIHKNGEVFEGTRRDFKSKYGVNAKPLFARNPLKQTKGWRLLSSTDK